MYIYVCEDAQEGLTPGRQSSNYFDLATGGERQRNRQNQYTKPSTVARLVQTTTRQFLNVSICSSGCAIVQPELATRH